MHYIKNQYLVSSLPNWLLFYDMTILSETSERFSILFAIVRMEHVENFH